MTSGAAVGGGAVVTSATSEAAASPEPRAPLRVLHVYKDVYATIPGGIECHIEAIRSALPDLRHDVLVCGRRLRTRVRPARGGGREILVGELGRVLSTPLAPTFPAWFRRCAAGAVVHVHMPQPVAEFSALLFRSRAPLVMTYHADIYRQRALLFLYRPLVVRCLRSADIVVTASDALGERSPIIRSAGVRPQVVRYGIDVSRFDRARVGRREVDALRRQYGARHVVAVGRLVPYKGFDRLIDAAGATPYPVVIVGDGPERPTLQGLIQRLGLDRRVHLVGRVDDARLAAHLAAASAFVLPSWNRAEALGIALLEAQAAELPVVATDVGTGTLEAFVPGETGIAIPPNDVQAIAAAVTRLLADPERAAAMGRAGRRWVEDRHSLASMAAALRPIYTSLAHRAAPSATAATAAAARRA